MAFALRPNCGGGLYSPYTAAPTAAPSDHESALSWPEITYIAHNVPENNLQFLIRFTSLLVCIFLSSIMASSQYTHFDRFKDLCAGSHYYPKTLLRLPKPHELHHQKIHEQYLKDNESRLFNEEDHLIELAQVDRQKRKNPISSVLLPTYLKKM
jgi:hypothetical protein